MLCMILVSTAVAQDFFTYSYRSADGLDTDVIKCITQDSLGFIWIGSDDGLYRFDGLNFERYADGAPGNFFKSFLTTSDGRLLGVHDMGITLIHPDISNPRFEVLLQGNRAVTDSTVYYPKTALEDSNGRIWISEPHAVVIYEKNGSWKRISFEPEDNTNSFVRSFNFIQMANKDVIVVSNPGNYYRYEETSNQFKRLTIPKRFTTNDLKQIGDKILVASGDGIKQAIFENDKVSLIPFEINNIDNTQEYQHIEPLNNHQFVLSGIYNNTCIVTIDSLIHGIKLSNAEMFVNQSYVDSEGNIWLSTEKGVLLISLPEFRKVNLSKPNNYIEALVTNSTSNFIYTLRSNSVWKINKETEVSSAVLTGKEEDYFLSGIMTNDILYVTSGQNLYKIKDDLIIKKQSFESTGRYMFDIVYDSINNDLWTSQEGFNGVHQIQPEDFTYTSYDSDKGIISEITGIKATSDGIYALSSNPDHYLYFKSHSDTVFTDLSTPFSNPNRIGLIVDDIALIDEFLLLATNYGLFTLENGELVKMSINQNFDNSGIRAIVKEDDYLWIATTAGLIRYGIKTHNYVQFSEASGLPVNTVNKQCLVINNNKLWVGTSQGVAVTDYKINNTSSKTKKPVILDFVVNGKSINFQPNRKIEVPFESYLSIYFSSLLYPTNDMEYSYKLNDKWSTPEPNSIVNLADLGDGEYTFQLKAKKVGNHKWSDPQTLIFHVAPPFYKRAPFILTLVLILAVAVYFTRFFTSKMEKRRQLLLTMLVEERTQELKKMKAQLETMVKQRTEELELTVSQLQNTQNQLIQAEKMASLGVLTAGIAHEINNPVNYLQAGLYSVETIMAENDTLIADHELEEVVNMMKLGIDRITNIVKGLSRYSHGGDQLMDKCDLHEVVKTSLLIMEHELKGRIDVIKTLNAENHFITANDGSIHQLLINLISNAVHAIDGTGTIEIQTTNINNSVELKIIDSGSGIDQEFLDKIYDPFFTTKAPGIGTGLGLFISKRIVTEHQGQIHFRSKKNKGTTVIITFKSWSNGDASEKESTIR